MDVCVCVMCGMHVCSHARVVGSASQFSEFHNKLTSSRVGDVTLRILEYEHRRHEVRLEEMKKIEELADAQARGDKDLEQRIRRSVQAAEKKASTKDKDKEKTKDREEKKLGGDEDAAAGGNGKARKSGKDKSGRERKGGDEADGKEKAITVTLPEGKVDLDTARAKTRLLMQKQDKLLCVTRPPCVCVSYPTLCPRLLLESR